MWKHNRLLNQFIQEVETQIDIADSTDDLIKIIENARNRKGSLRFNSLDYLLYFILTLSTLSISGYLFWKTDEIFLLFLTIAALFILIVLIAKLRARQKRIADLSGKIYYRNLLFNNRLIPLKSHQGFSLRSLKSRFSEFSLGNRATEIRTLIQGNYEGGIKPFTFHYYHFFYSTEKFSNSKDYKHAADMAGKTIYQQHHRYGIIIPFEAPAALTITELTLPLELRQWQYKDQTLPANFRKRFSLQTSSPQFAKQFLNPLAIDLIESLATSFNTINIEIRGGKELLFSCTDSGLLAANQQQSLKNIDAFLLEIRNISKAPKLEIVLSTLYRLIKHLK